MKDSLRVVSTNFIGNMVHNKCLIFQDVSTVDIGDVPNIIMVES